MRSDKLFSKIYAEIDAARLRLGEINQHSSISLHFEQAGLTIDFRCGEKQLEIGPISLASLNEGEQSIGKAVDSVADYFLIAEEGT